MVRCVESEALYCAADAAVDGPCCVVEAAVQAWVGLRSYPRQTLL